MTEVHPLTSKGKRFLLFPAFRFRQVSGEKMGGSEVLRPRTLVWLTAGACAAVTAVVVAVPSIHLAYRAPSLRVTLETASVLIALLMALLVYGRARRTRSSNELVLAFGLVWLAAANLLTAVLVVTELQV